LEEQRTHISMLEKALSNAQERLAKREKVCDELTIAAERANHLQRLLHETLLDKQARDETHAQERVQWEMDMTQLKMQLNKDFSQNGSLKRLSRLAGDSGDETINRLKKTMYLKDERITHLERTVIELQRRLQEESDRKKCVLGALNENFDSKIKQYEDEQASKDRRITLVAEERVKLGEILDVSAKERDNDTAIGMHKMEEIRQKIQERKRKGRICATGGTSSGPFEQNILDSAALLSDISTPYGNRPAVSSGYHNLFNAEKRENSEVDSVWNV
uniref:Coiled-coil domain-containing protein 39 n=1 Tax=Angiostrongylus cantonensis TaxID=6313 RepID=A0A0K0D6C9_ANGCA